MQSLHNKRAGDKLEQRRENYPLGMFHYAIQYATVLRHPILRNFENHVHLYNFLSKRLYFYLTSFELLACYLVICRKWLRRQKKIAYIFTERSIRQFNCRLILLSSDQKNIDSRNDYLRVLVARCFRTVLKIMDSAMSCSAKGARPFLRTRGPSFVFYMGELRKFLHDQKAGPNHKRRNRKQYELSFSAMRGRNDKMETREICTPTVIRGTIRQPCTRLRAYAHSKVCWQYQRYKATVV